MQPFMVVPVDEWRTAAYAWCTIGPGVRPTSAWVTTPCFVFLRARVKLCLVVHAVPDGSYPVVDSGSEGS